MEHQVSAGSYLWPGHTAGYIPDTHTCLFLPSGLCSPLVLPQLCCRQVDRCMLAVREGGVHRCSRCRSSQTRLSSLCSTCLLHKFSLRLLILRCNKHNLEGVDHLPGGVFRAVSRTTSRTRKRKNQRNKHIVVQTTYPSDDSSSFMLIPSSLVQFAITVGCLDICGYVPHPKSLLHLQDSWPSHGCMAYLAQALSRCHVLGKCRYWPWIFSH